MVAQLSEQKKHRHYVTSHCLKRLAVEKSQEFGAVYLLKVFFRWSVKTVSKGEKNLFYSLFKISERNTYF